MINLDQKKMRVIATAAHGVVNQDTIFLFTQVDDCVNAKYSGGMIKQGFLVGMIKENVFEFSYCQLQKDGLIDHGKSKCELNVGENGKIRLIEHFQWGSRSGESGVNMFEEL